MNLAEIMAKIFEYDRQRQANTRLLMNVNILNIRELNEVVARLPDIDKPDFTEEELGLLDGVYDQFMGEADRLQERVRGLRMKAEAIGDFVYGGEGEGR